MHAFVVSLSIAAALTSIFAFRYAMSQAPKWLAAYFALFLTLEWAGEHFLLPEGALPIEVAYVCFGITVLFVIASILRDRLAAESEGGA